MSIYVIGAIDIEDPEIYKIYGEKGLPSLQSSSVEIVAVDNNPVLIEGELPAKRIIVLKFESQDEMEKWYKSDSYQAALPYRLKSSKTSFLLTVNSEK